MSTKDFGISAYDFQNTLGHIPLQNIKSFHALDSAGTEYHLGFSVTSSGPFFGLTAREYYTREIFLEISKDEKGGG